MPDRKKSSELIAAPFSTTNIADKPDDSLVVFMEVLEEIDENVATAELNKISMADGRGGRIYY